VRDRNNRRRSHVTVKINIALSTSVKSTRSFFWFYKIAMGVNRQMIALASIAIYIHAWYSARELSTVIGSRTLTTSTIFTLHSIEALPSEIMGEVLAATILACFHFNYGASYLRPITWCSWAGTITREYEYACGYSHVGSEYIASPFSVLDSRPSFTPIRSHRRQSSIRLLRD
jgi:hypothetical protein